MAVTVEGKLELFKKILFEHIEEDWAEKRNELIKAMEEKKEEKKKEFEKRKRAIVEDGEGRAQAKRKSIIAQVQSEADYEVMKKREALLSDLMGSLMDWSREFIKTDGYKSFLSNNIEKALHMMDGEELLFSFSEKDMNELGSFIKESVERLKNNKNIELIKSSTDIIGGFTLEDKNSGVLADFSIKTLIDEGKEYMGRMLYEKLDEVLKA
ncbi:V-type ATP synthase subunit E [Lutispora saccharofermentans]|uniref:V-type proton ATPase subunit E n=1 Tax=Lutispora saccharofermentans TaxID=3024236 RepID=A0ABT1ND76_9FIRM|nr:V-type ATP synthase subunit E family protein [Lutispora saccharofermentans]MCQ1529217.1 hypothetical protein [Lutispora saccharofermentans]